MGHIDTFLAKCITYIYSVITEAHKSKKKACNVISFFFFYPVTSENLVSLATFPLNHKTVQLPISDKQLFPPPHTLLCTGD